MKPRWGAILTFIAGITLTGQAMAVENNLKFNGTLVSEPCDLDPATSDLTVDFKSVIKKYLYINNRTESIPFTINLINCDISMGSSVIFTFKGAESQSLPGTLSVSGSASGIAIGMETQQGVAIPFNQPTPATTLVNGNNTLIFGAYVAGEPDAIKNQTIAAGNFTAIATFEMNYQ